MVTPVMTIYIVTNVYSNLFGGFVTCWLIETAWCIYVWYIPIILLHHVDMIVLSLFRFYLLW